MSNLTQTPPQGLQAQVAWCIAWIYQLRGRLSTSGGGGTPSLTSTYIGYGDGSNQLTGDSNFTYSPGSEFSLNITGSTILVRPINTLIKTEDGTQFIIADGGIFSLITLPAFANDAAAIAGGLVSNNLYKSTTAGSTFLKIVP